MIKILAIIDFSNLMGQCRNVGRKPDLITLRDHLSDPRKGRFCVDVKVYAPLPHNNGAATHRFHDSLRHQGLQVIGKRAKKLPDGSMKCNLDIELTLGALEALDMVHPPDSIVLVSGDSDFAPLCCALRNKGFFVEVAGIANSVAGELKAASQGFIDLTEWANNCPKLNPDAPDLGGDDIFEANLF